MGAERRISRKEERMEEKVVLIDGHSILNRAFYGVPELTNKDGLHTNAVYGFLNIMFKILEEEKPEYLVVAFDVKEPTFRHAMYEAYKGTRKPMPEQLREQVPVIKEVLHAMKIKTVEQPGLEADDILGTLARKAEREGKITALVSGDRDLLQLATEKIKIRIPKTKRGGTEIEDYNTSEVIEKYGVTPLQIIDLKGLMGDASDNIPGIPGVGEKTAAKLIAEFGTVENACDHVDEIKPAKAQNSLREHMADALLSKQLATIKTDCDLKLDWEDCRIGEFYNEDSYEQFARLEFKSYLSRFGREMTSNASMEAAFQTIEDLAAGERFFGEEKKRRDTLGLSLAADGSGIRGAALSDGRKTVFLRTEGFLTEDYLLEQIQQLIQCGRRIGLLDVKGALSWLEAGEESLLFDCGVAAYLLNPLKSSYTGAELSNDYLDYHMPAYDTLFGKAAFAAAWEDKQEEMIRYCCYGACTAASLTGILTEKLQETGMWKLFEEIEMPLVYTLYDMEQSGIRVNKEELQAYGQRLNDGIVVLEQEIYHLAGEEFNINSPKQLGVILFEKLLLPFGKKTKTGYSTSADILEKLKCEHPIVEKILEYRQLTKLKSTYADGLAAFINPEDQRIHGTFNQTITATGRLSSTEPNLQNIPIRMELGREIRKVFIPEEGSVFLDADYSQIELRILAAMSGDSNLIDAYRQDQDIHRITASKVFHTPLDQVTPEQRSNAKAANFGIVYGISSFGLGHNLSITRKEAEGYIKSYFKTYPRVKEFLDGLVEQGKRLGYVESLYRRRRPIPELSSSNFMQRSFGERVAMNSPIQGTAADIMKIAMLRVNRRIRKEGLQSKLIVQIHDELLIETKMEEKEQVARILEEEMTHAASLPVPLQVEVKEGRNWYESK